jgi:hypothetical protein
MIDGARAAFSSRFSPQLTRWLALGWTAAIAFVWLFRYEAWVLPVQFNQLLMETIPSLRIGPHFGEFWVARLADAGCLIGILAAAFGVGAIVVSQVSGEKGLLAGLFALAIGLWVTVVAVLSIGAFSVAHCGWVLALLVCWIHPAPREFFHRSQGERLDGWSRFVPTLIGVAALLNLLGAMAPPFEYDELEYHLGALSEYVRAGKIIALPHNFYSNMPQLTEMLYLLAMQMRSDIAAKLLHWAFGLLAALAIYAVGARVWSRRVGVTAAALFYCLPFVQDLSQTARVDLATTFFATLAFGGLLVAGDDRRWLWLAGVTTGCAVATKWPAVALVLLPGVVLVAYQWKSFRLLARFCLLAGLPILPWLIKNWLLAGNPVYPMLDGLFLSPHWSASQTALFAAKHSPRFDADGLRQFFTRGWQYSFTEPGAAPLLLMTAPLAFVLRNAGNNLRRLAWLFAGAYCGWYLLTFRPWRFLMPAMPLAALIGAVALDAVGKWSRVVVAAAMIVGLTLVAANDLVDVGNPRRVPAQMSFLTHALGEDSKEEFVSYMGQGMFEPIVWMNHNLPATAKVLYIGEARTHYARHPVVWSTAFDQPPLAQNPPATWDEALRQQDITHIYINAAELQRLQRSYGYLKDLDWHAFRRWLEHARLIHQSGRGFVYELKQ